MSLTTSPAPVLAGIKSVFVARLATATGVTVYEHATPAGVATSKPWLVTHWIDGGGQVGSAAARSDQWAVPVQVTAVAHSPTSQFPLPEAIYDAAQWATDQAHAVLCAPLDWADTDGYRIVACELRSQGGVLVQGPTVNIPDQWMLTVHRD